MFNIGGSIASIYFLQCFTEALLPMPRNEGLTYTPGSEPTTLALCSRGPRALVPGGSLLMLSHQVRRTLEMFSFAKCKRMGPVGHAELLEQTCLLPRFKDAKKKAERAFGIKYLRLITANNRVLVNFEQTIEEAEIEDGNTWDSDDRPLIIQYLEAQLGVYTDTHARTCVRIVEKPRPDWWWYENAFTYCVVSTWAMKKGSLVV